MNYRIMGIDYGLKRIGIAMSDAEQIIASPFSVIESVNLQENVKQILSLAVKNNVGEIVVGIPFNMDGSESAMSAVVREFIKNIKEISSLPVVEIDERLTTMQSGRIVRENGKLSKNIKNKVIDKIAASLILGVYLEKKCIS